MEANRSEECREDRLGVRASAWIALGAALLSLGLSIIASVGLYANFDMVSAEIPGPHPVLGALGAAALKAELLAFVPTIALAALALFLGIWRPPRLKNCAIAFVALFLCGVTGGIRGATISQVRASPFRHRATAAARLAPIIRRYADEHGGSLPPAATWCEALNSLDPNAADYLAYLTYPMARDEPKGLSWLALNANLDGDSLVTLADDVVLLFETEPTVNPAGNLQLLSSYARGKRGVLVVFGDLHIEFVRPKHLEDLRWQLSP